MGSTTTTTIQQPDFAREVVARTAWKNAVLGTLSILTRVLAVRLTVLISVLGAIYLTWVTLADPTPYKLYALAIYGAGVVLPAVVLAALGR